MAYDSNNVFARILRGEVPCKTLYEDEHTLAFSDIHPLAPTHVVVIPKGSYTSFDDFSERASEAELAGFFRAVGQVAREVGVQESGYRLIANHGRDAFQEVPHFHVYVLGGRPLGPNIYRWETEQPTRSAVEDDLTLYFLPHDGDASQEQIAAVAHALELEVYEASLLLGRAPLPRVIKRGPSADIRDLNAQLEGAGLPVRTLETDALLFNLEPWKVQQVAVEGDTLVLQGPDEERIELPAGRSTLLVRGYYAWLPDKPVTGRMPAWTSGARRGKSTTHMPRMNRTSFVHLYLAGEPRPLAFLENEIRDWRFLGDEMASSAHANFERLVELLAERPNVLVLDGMLKHQVLVKSCTEAFWEFAQRPETTSLDVDAEVLSRLVYYSTVVTASPAEGQELNGAGAAH